MTQPDLFDDSIPDAAPAASLANPLKRMARRTDGVASKEAAERVSKQLSKLQKTVIIALSDYGKPMTDEDLEVYCSRLGNFAQGTIRKRRTELTRMGKIVEAGTTKNSRGSTVTLWRLA